MTTETSKIKVGDKIPEHTFTYLKGDDMTPITTAELFDNKKVVLFGLPGAFTPTCSAHHLPGFIQDFEKFQEFKVDTIICISVNDAFVMKSWAAQQKAGDKVLLLPDGDASFTKKMGLEMDTAGFGGVRCQRFLSHVDNGKLTHFAIEEPKKFEVSSSESSLAFLGKDAKL
eukprot:CAMPEP_0201516664 /NCGR_PEP_ID=MMETSP0161_2-20130828/7936_1 /ASSEMBLY_ACC=CAM_ASM_000251 /TAXON_ID=180227 /ORGANISM="Neoparamoeba aestuarina, Strain SoJaBio B1-5/56/2" /LENGTH=170 /DNA_ID=CAMNT_0047913883 /DNA_START=134 /DNA_END=646 /DNA_ORIENTATION=+